MTNMPERKLGPRGRALLCFCRHDFTDYDSWHLTTAQVDISRRFLPRAWRAIATSARADRHVCGVLGADRALAHTAAAGR